MFFILESGCKLRWRIYIRQLKPFGLRCLRISVCLRFVIDLCLHLVKLLTLTNFTVGYSRNIHIRQLKAIQWHAVEGHSQNLAGHSELYITEFYVQDYGYLNLAHLGVSCLHKDIRLLSGKFAVKLLQARLSTAEMSVCVCQSAQLFKKCIIISCISFDLLPIYTHFNTEYLILKFLHLTEMLKTSHLCSMLSRDNGVVGFKHQIRKCFGLKCLFCRHKHSMRCPDFPSNTAGNVPLKILGGFKLPSVETRASRLWLHHHLLHLPVWRSVNKHVMWMWLNTCCRNVNMVNMTCTKVNIFTETLTANILLVMGLWSIISIHWGSCFLYKPSFNPFFSQLKIQKNI